MQVHYLQPILSQSKHLQTTEIYFTSLTTKEGTSGKGNSESGQLVI